MKQCRLLLSSVVAILFVSGSVWPETVHWNGDYTTAQTVHGDLVVTNGDVNIPYGNLTVNGDLKVTAGRVHMCGGDLKVTGDLIVTNTFPNDQSHHGDAFVFVSGDLEVTGAIITKSKYSRAFVDARDPYQTECPYAGGDIKAGRISTSGAENAHVIADHFINVVGAIVTKSEFGHAFVSSRGTAPCYGDLHAGAIFAYAANVNGEFEEYYGCSDRSTAFMGTSRTVEAPTPSGAVVEAVNGHVVVTGPIVTYAKAGELFSRSARVIPYANAFVFAHGDLSAAAITTYADHDAYISAEKITVKGDIRTEAPGYMTVGGDGHVEARMTSLGEEFLGTFEDIIAQNIYTKGYLSAYVKAYRHIDVKGDIVTWETLEEPEEELPNDSAYVLAGAERIRNGEQSYEGLLKAQNVMTRGPESAYVYAENKIDVSGEILTRSLVGDASVETYFGHIKAGNIATNAGGDAYVMSQMGDIDVAHVIWTNGSSYESRFRDNGGGHAYVRSYYANVFAEKIFTDGYYGSSVEAGHVPLSQNKSFGGGDVRVKGPISTKSYESSANVYAVSDIVAGAISTDGDSEGFVRVDLGSINVAEDIRTKSFGYDASVQALSGDITARSIKTDTGPDYLSRVPANDSIRAGAGTGHFTLVPNLRTADITIENAEFDLDSDHEWDTKLIIEGTCTLNGKGHHLNLGPNGAIEVAAGSVLHLQNIEIRNVQNYAITCQDATAEIHFHNVTFVLSGDYLFDTGSFFVTGDFLVKGPGRSFRYQSSEQSMVKKSGTLLFDHGVTFLFYGDETDIAMEDGTARIHFNDSTLDAREDIRLEAGTLLIENTVTFSAQPGNTIYFGDGSDAAQNITFEFVEATASKLLLAGDYQYENV
jgi:hypothetical protein